MLQKIKLLLGIADTSKDDLLNLLIDLAKNQVIDYTHNPHCLPLLEGTVCDMVVYNYNRMGTEGLSSEGYSGVSFSYSTDYPESILRSLKAHRKVRFM